MSTHIAYSTYRTCLHVATPGKVVFFNYMILYHCFLMQTIHSHHEVTLQHPFEFWRSCQGCHVKCYVFVLNTLLDKYIPRGRSANGTRGPMRGTPPIRHITHRTYKRK